MLAILPGQYCILQYSSSITCGLVKLSNRTRLLMPMSQDLEQVDHDSDKIWATVGIAVKETTLFTWYIVLIVT